MDNRCSTHQFELAEAICRNCGDLYCNECLVYSFGPKKPPYCISCALAASGVRSNAAKRPKLSRREFKRRQQAAEEVLSSTRNVAAPPTLEIDWSSDYVSAEQSSRAS